MHAFMSRRWLAATVALLVAGATALVLLVYSNTAQSQDPPPTDAAAATFSSLEPFAQGSLRSDTAKALKSIMPSTPDSATPASSSEAADTLLASDGDQVCLIVEARKGPAAVGCGSLARGFGTEDLGASVMFLGSQYLVSGAAPDGTRDIVVHGESGAATRVDATNNSYSALLDTVPAQVSWTDAAGNSHKYNLIDPTR